MSVNVIAEHATADGFSIAIIRNNATKAVPAPLFQVVRINVRAAHGMRAGAYVVLRRVTTEVEARQVANEEWLGDMGRPVPHKMITRGVPAI